MDSIATARDFFINQQGMSPDQADMLVSQGLQAYNQQTQPQSMMQMASGGRIGYGIGSLVKSSGVAEPVSGGQTSSGGFGGMGLIGKLIQQNPQMFRRIETSRTDFIDVNQNGIDDRQEAAYGGRIGYQLGGISAMPMDYGQPLQIPQQQQPSFSSAQNITMNPLASYGEPQLGQAGGTPLMMQGGGIARLGYQSGGVTLPSQGSEMSQMEGMDQQQALQTIIQILIENGIPPEQAQQLALQIIQIFAQGGAPAVEAFADQLEQEEVQAMASGGIAGYAYRQGYGFGGIGKIFSGAAKAVSGVVKGVAKAVKSVAKSPIGRAALTVAAATFLGPGAFGIQGLGLSGLQLGLATAAANAGLQKLGGGKFSLLEAGLSGLSAGLSNPTVPASSATNITVPGSEVANAYNVVGVGNTTVPYSGLEADVSSMIAPKTLPSGATNYAYAPDVSKISIDPAAGTNTSLIMEGKQPGFFENLTNKAQSGIQSLYNDPIGTVKNLATSAYDYAKENPLTTAIGVSSLATLGSQLGVPRNEGEDDASYAKRLEEAQGYITQYGRNLQIRNPYFYQREGAVNPFAPTMAANGGIMGYAKGGTARLGYRGAGMVSPRSNPTQQDELNQAALDVFKRPLHQLTPEEVDMLIEFIKEKFGKAPMQEDTTFAARGGSMIPPARQIEGGIIELDARKTGGYIPYGKKERVDDVPAMLAKDEFVFTSRAVKAAGGGSARQGAAKMYKLMKQLEAKGRKMERGARA